MSYHIFELGASAERSTSHRSRS